MDLNLVFEHLLCNLSHWIDLRNTLLLGHIIAKMKTDVSFVSFSHCRNETCYKCRGQFYSYTACFD